MFNYNLFLKHLSNRKRKYKQSFIKNEIAQRLLNRLDFIKIGPKDIFIDGYTDNDLINIISKRFPKSQLHNKHDNQKFDLIISNSVIHLTDNIANSLDDYYELLNDDGILLFSTFGDRCLETLNKAFSSVDKLKHTNNMIDPMTWGSLLQSSRYKTTAIESDVIIFTYEDTKIFFEDIRALNEPLADKNMHTSLTGKNRWNKFLKLLKDNLQIEIEALYGYAIRKANDNNITPQANFNRISIEDLKTQILEFKNTNNT